MLKNPVFKRYLLLGIAASLFIAAGVIIWLSLSPSKSKAPGTSRLTELLEPPDNTSQVVYTDQPVKLTYWRTWDGVEPINSIVADFKKLHPNVEIEVRDIDYGVYDQELTKAAQAGNLPDMFTVLNDWLPRYIDQTTPAPKTVYTEQAYKDIFVAAAANRLLTNGQINGVSFGVSTLGLYYNIDLLKADNVNPPTNWDEFVVASQKLTKKTGTTITQSGAALGTPFIHQSVDIEAALMLQNGATMTDSPPTKALFAQPDKAGTAVGAKALDFYASFARQNKANYSFQDSLGYTVQAFANGKVAMMLNYPFKSIEVYQFNPKASFKMAKLPQIKGEKEINFAQYWVEMVNKKSANSEIAWDFLRFAATKDQQKRFNKTTLRPTSRKDLLGDQKADDKLGPFVQQTESAQTFYRGQDKDMNGYFYDANISVLSGLEPQPALRQAETRATATIVQWPYK